VLAKSGSNAVLLLAIFLFRSCANAALTILTSGPGTAAPHSEPSQKTASSIAIVISADSAGSHCDAAEKPNRMIHPTLLRGASFRRRQGKRQYPIREGKELSFAARLLFRYPAAHIAPWDSVLASCYLDVSHFGSPLCQRSV
jgi:hypothetical protein